MIQIFLCSSASLIHSPEKLQVISRIGGVLTCRCPIAQATGVCGREDKNPVFHACNSPVLWNLATKVLPFYLGLGVDTPFHPFFYK